MKKISSKARKRISTAPQLDFSVLSACLQKMVILEDLDLSGLQSIYIFFINPLTRFWC